MVLQQLLIELCNVDVVSMRKGFSFADTLTANTINSHDWAEITGHGALPTEAVLDISVGIWTCVHCH